MVLSKWCCPNGVMRTCVAGTPAREGVRGVASVQTALKEGYGHFKNGKFVDALAAFQSILEMIPLTVAETRRDADDVKELLSVCREYHTGLRCEIERRKVPSLPFPSPSRLHCAIFAYLPTVSAACSHSTSAGSMRRETQVDTHSCTNTDLEAELIV